MSTVTTPPAAAQGAVVTHVESVHNIVPGNVVRLVRAFGPGKSIAVLGTVLNVAPITKETVGADGEPELTAVYLKPNASQSVLGSVNWHQAFERVSGILHHSHPDVIAGRHGIYWVDSVDHEEAAQEGLPVGLPEIGGAGESAVFSREMAEYAMSQEPKVVPQKVEAVPPTEERLAAAIAGGRVQDHTPSAADLAAHASEQAAAAATIQATAEAPAHVPATAEQVRAGEAGEPSGAEHTSTDVPAAGNAEKAE